MIEPIEVESSPPPVIEREPNETMRGHLLMPDDIKASIPKLFSQRKLGEQAVVYLQFQGTNHWQWLITEYDGNDKLYGMLMGFEIAWGEFSLKELASIIDKGWYRNSDPRVGVMRKPSVNSNETVEKCVTSLRAAMPWRFSSNY